MIVGIWKSEFGISSIIVAWLFPPYFKFYSSILPLGKMRAGMVDAYLVYAYHYNWRGNTMTKKYDVIIVGGGPAGIMAALEITQSSNLRLLLVEKGKDLGDRVCPSRDTAKPCVSCAPCNLVCGLGGAGAFSDGKLTLTPEVGGWLKEYLGEAPTEDLLKYIDQVYINFGAPDKLYGIGSEVEKLRNKAILSDLKLVTVPLRHLGTENCFSVLKSMRDHLNSHLDVKLRTLASRVIIENNAVKGIETADDESYDCDYLILAPGREGADWLSKEALRLNLTMRNNPVDVGVRVEVPRAVMEPLTDVLYEAKLEYFSKSFDDRLRTFCMCPGGEVTMENTGGTDPVITVNGHSYAGKGTENTNFAILVSTDFTKPFHEPIAYGKYIARLANILSGGVLVQRLGDLTSGHRTNGTRIEKGLVQPTLKSAVPGDLSFVLPYRHLKSIIEMLQAMDQLAPGVASRHTLLYGVEVKFYSLRPQLNAVLETEVHNLFAVGDGAGVSRGLSLASASGVVAAREILKRSKEENPKH